jgi:predicted AlkP superfamily phosphohydrolase/phosphomutase
MQQMTGPVVAIGLDSFDPTLFEQWLDQGHLPNLRKLRDRGAWGRLDSTDSETAWTSVLTGIQPWRTGFLGHYTFDPGDYDCAMPGTYDFQQYPPFYAIGDEYQVAAIDVPQVRMAENVKGVQVLAYGAHAPFTARESRPPDLLPRLIKKYGDHPAANGTDYARFWRRRSMDDLVCRLNVGAKRRAAICRDLLQSQDWDLFLVVFSEVHSVSHYLWHTVNASHPLYEQFRDTFETDRMLEVATTVDNAVGDVLSAVSPGTRIIAFSQEGMVANSGDIPGALFLPEMLYRYSFPGCRGIDPDPRARAGQNDSLPSPILHPRSWAWHREAWAMKHDDNRLRRFLRRNLPIEFGWLVEKVMGSPPGPGHPLNFDVKYQPAVLYSRYWPQMKAFALPTASQQGKIRINLEGREAQGVVQATDYEAVCAEITAHLYELRNARTGRSLVSRVMSQGKDGPARSSGGFADLLVEWCPEPTDIIDSPVYGPFGPVQYMRTGGHIEKGFAIVAGPGVPPSSTLADGHVLDLAPTILSLVGAPLSPHFDGRSLRLSSGAALSLSDRISKLFVAIACLPIVACI